MKNINREKLNLIVETLMIKPSDEVLDGILEDWNEIQSSIENLNKIDTTNIEPLTRINENLFLDFLREDVNDNSWSINKKQLLENSKDSDNNFILTKKVVE